ncbi:MAG: Uncharacterized protein FD163_757 [Hyphomonadaceae bacterium]|nr:MAG: Uncharacterized protein FD163_757 [Hyphomonadaceae bacterium]
MGLKLNRRNLLFAGINIVAAPYLGGCASISSQTNEGPAVAITIDDFALGDTALLSGAARDAAILAALRRFDLSAAGFVAGKHIDNAKGAEVLRNWSDQGHIIGNHTYSHNYYGGRDPQAMIADILRCEALLQPYAGFKKLFRFPYLAEGRTAEGRDAMRILLAENGYQNAHVTIDTSDWYIDQRLKEKLAREPNTDLSPYRAFFLEHIWARAQYYDGLAKLVFGHSIKHTILLHHNLTTALFLGDLLAMFRRNNWRLVNAADAFAADEFKAVFSTIPSGQSLVWAGAKEKNLSPDLRYPSEDSKYEKPRMDELGL